MTYQFTKLQYVEHFQVSPGFLPVQFGNELPESVNTRECHQALSVQFPSIAADNNISLETDFT